MVVVVMLQLVHGYARVEHVTQQDANIGELPQHAIHCCQADIRVVLHHAPDDDDLGQFV